MATAFTTPHAHHAMGSRTQVRTTGKKPAKRGLVAKFVSDLFEDLAQKPLQPAALARHDMFHEHILAMSISYFALIVLLVAASLPALAYFVAY